MTPAEQREFAARQRALRAVPELLRFDDPRVKEAAALVNTQAGVNEAESSVNAEVSGGVESRHVQDSLENIEVADNRGPRRRREPEQDAIQAGVAPSPLTSVDRHKPGYMAAYMRRDRAKKKLKHDGA